MANSEMAQVNFERESLNYQRLIDLMTKISKTTDFITDVEASQKMGVSYGDMVDMIKNKEIIAYKAHVLYFIPLFQFDEDKNTINELFKEFLNMVKKDVNSERGKHRSVNLVFNTLIEYFTFDYEDQFGGKSTTKFRGFEYIKHFGSDGVKSVADSLHRTVYHEMGM